MKKILWILIILAAAAAVWYICAMVQKSRKLNAFLESFQLNEAELSAVADGAYTGEADAGLIRVRAAVTVKDGKIVNISLLQHQNGQGDAAGAITDRMVEEQRIGVDAVSGATYSSRVIQKAVENALRRDAP